jgi:hypothetical protein
LTELIVVVSIIALLIGLTCVYLKTGEDAATRLENQMVAANPQLHKFKRKTGVNRPPAGSLAIPNQYIVTFAPTVTNPQALAAQLAQTVPANVLHVYTTAIKGCSVRIQPGTLAALQAIPGVLRVEQDQQAYACQAIVPTGVSRIRAVVAPRSPPFPLYFPGMAPVTRQYAQIPIGNLPLPPTPGSQVVPAMKAIAVIDSGIDSTHPDLNVVFSMGFGLPNGEDQNGHGTHVSGTAGARGLSGQVVGVFPGVPLWSLRVLDATGAGSSAQIIAALDFLAANANQVSVGNMSLGGPFSQAVNDATDACVNAGVVMCVAAGNAAVNASGLSPASAPLAICVAAMCDTDGRPGGLGPAGSAGDPDDTFASFSNFSGPVAVVAPGEDILSTWPLSIPPGGSNVLSGTSMATPHVSGLAALILTTLSPNLNGGVGVIGNVLTPSFGGGGSPAVTTPAQVRNFLLQESVERIAGLAANMDTLTYPMITGRP